jgi:hypothetical protein
MNYEDELRNALPRWLEDGKGLRGDVTILYSASRDQAFPSSAIAFQNASVSEPIPSLPFGNEPEPFAALPGVTYPWIGQDTDDDGNYMAWFGVGDAGFTPNDGTSAASLKYFQARIFDPNDGNASQFFLTVGNYDYTTDGIVAQFGGNTLKATWTDNDFGPEVYLEGSDSTNVSLHPEDIVFTNSDNTHASGLHAQYLDFDNASIFLGCNDDQGYELTITDGSHAIGLHPGYLDLDNSSIFLGYDDNQGEYLLTISDGTLSCGLHTGYLELASQKVFLGYSSSEETTHLTIVPDTAYVELGTSSQVFLGYGDGEWHLEISGNDAAYSYLTKDDLTLENGEDSTDLSAGELELTSGTDSTDLSAGELILESGTDSTDLSAGELVLESGTDSTDLSAGELVLESGTDSTDLSAGELVLESGTDSTDLSAGELQLESGSDSTNVSAGEIEVTDGSGTASITGNSMTVDDSGGFYVGSATLTDSGLSTGSDGGCYIGSTSYGEGYITMDGHTFSAVSATWCDGSGGSVSGYVLAATD